MTGKLLGGFADSEEEKPVAMGGDAPVLMRSLFHEPWWLDAAAPGGWDEVSINVNGSVTARLPFVIKRIAGVTTLAMPPLTRTLGPQLPLCLHGGSAREQRRLAGELIAMLPRHGSFKQIFDPQISDALAFYAHGYRSGLEYTMRIAAEISQAERWLGIRHSMRQAIRKAEKRFVVETIGIEEFCEFHNYHMKSNHRVWWTKLFARRSDRVKIRVFEAALARGAARVLAARDEAGVLRAAIVLVWGHGVMFYLLTAHDAAMEGSGAVKLLVWEAMKLAQAENLAFDFDGFFRPSAVNFQTGFGGVVCNRILVTKTPPMLVVARAVKSRLRIGF